MNGGGDDELASDQEFMDGSFGGQIRTIKLLVSANVAGSLIGKGGMSIRELQVKTGARVRVNQSGNFLLMNYSSKTRQSRLRFNLWAKFDHLFLKVVG